jgi:signal transduction histidine kinase
VTLRTRLGLVWGLATVVAVVAVTVLAAAQQARALRQSAERRGETLARALGRRCERALAQAPGAPRAATLGPVLEGLWEEEGLLGAEVVGLDGEVLAAQRFGSEPAPLRVAYPVRADGAAVALVRVVLSRAWLAAATAAVWRSAAGVGLAIMLIGAAVAAALAAALTRPLAGLAAAAARLAAGDPAARVAPRGSSEIAALARSFAAMRDAVVEREGRLAAQNQELVRLSEAREALTHMIVHDLKSPIASVRAGLDAVRAGVGVEDREIVDLMRQRADGALRLATDLLDVHRLADGRLAPQRTPLDAAELCREAAAACALEAGERRVDIAVDAPPALGLAADRELLERVLVNLLVNALRHGRGDVQLAAAADEDGVRFSVADHGPGIPAAERAHVFEMFGQGARSRAERRGAGIGLAFCKLAVEAHGGRIWLESEEGRGSRFCLVVPRAY